MKEADPDLTLVLHHQFQRRDIDVRLVQLTDKSGSLFPFV